MKLTDEEIEVLNQIMEVMCCCNHPLYKHENYSDLPNGMLVGKCCEDNCTCKLFKKKQQEEK